MPGIDDLVIERYRKNYRLREAVSAKQILLHWTLETNLTKTLLASSKEDRWEVFERCYTSLYKNLPWLNSANEEETTECFAHWSSLLKPGSKVFEVGSGKARLLRQLASLGHDCVATEITRERGEKHARGRDDIAWHQTDGVNLAKFEPPSTYDVVISSQVIEHLHPDDIETHFENVRTILKPGGTYICDTPHRGAGPHDLSRVFGLDRAACMHLKEYTFLELRRIAENCGASPRRLALGWSKRCSARGGRCASGRCAASGSCATAPRGTA